MGVCAFGLTGPPQNICTQGMTFTDFDTGACQAQHTQIAGQQLQVC